MRERYRYLSRIDRYNREAAYYNSDVQDRNNKKIEKNNKRRDYEDKKYASIATIIINELAKRKIEYSSENFYQNLDSIIDITLQQKLTQKLHPDLNAETLKNVILRKINEKELER